MKTRSENLAGAAPIAPEPMFVFQQLGDSPEGVALVLFSAILNSDPHLTSRPNNRPIASGMLDLYAACLEAARGERGARTDTLN